MSRIIATTNRLVLKEFSIDDIDGFFELNNDPVVLKYTGDKAFVNKTEVAEFISKYDQYEKYGFGRWSVYLKDTNQYVGFTGLRHSKESKDIDIGFRINRKYWGKGFATESAMASLNVAFHQYNVEQVTARAMKDNVASHTVIKKLAMKYHSEFEETGKLWIKYTLSQADWLSKCSNR